MSHSNQQSFPSTSTSSQSQDDLTCHDQITIPNLILSVTAISGIGFLIYFLRNRQLKKRLVIRPTSQLPTPSLLCALARAYKAIDPDSLTQQQLNHQLTYCLSQHANPRVISKFAALLEPSNRLKFGTAGVRSDVGFGYSRLNVVTVSAVVNAVLHVAKLSSSNTVVIGHDARHQSRKFAIVIAQICLNLGTKVYLFSKSVPTPFVAFAVRYFHSHLGFCVTASHNPPSQNGIKVFWNDGVQIRPDVADQIELTMKKNRDVNIPTNINLSDKHLDPNIIDPLDEICEQYYATITKCLKRRTTKQNSSSQPLVYTACHGVGYEYIEHIFSKFGLPPVIPCIEQCQPDPNFPTLPFPNPEEKGALDLAIQTAKENDSKLVIANDPDADRLGAAELDNDGSVRIFTGDEIALLFADYLTTTFQEDDMSKYAIVASAVSSKVVDSMAKKRGFCFHESLTGFKWLNKVALDLTNSGKTVLLSYEEAIGFNVSQNIVCDKDGISAAAVFAEMSATLYESGDTLTKRIDQLLLECGEHISSNGYLRLSEESPSAAQIFNDARDRGLPISFGKSKIVSIRDLTKGTDSAEPDGKATLPADGTSQFLTFRCVKSNDEKDPSLIIHLRGSGTGKLFSDFQNATGEEPKIKYYSELRCTREEVANGTAKKSLIQARDDAIEQVLQPEQNKLVRR